MFKQIQGRSLKSNVSKEPGLFKIHVITTWTLLHLKMSVLLKKSLTQTQEESLENITFKHEVYQAQNICSYCFLEGLWNSFIRSCCVPGRLILWSTVREESETGSETGEWSTVPRTLPPSSNYNWISYYSQFDFILQMVNMNDIMCINYMEKWH